MSFGGRGAAEAQIAGQKEVHCGTKPLRDLGDGEDGLGPCRATVPRVAAAEYLGAGGLVLVPQRLGLLQPHRREGHRRGPHLILSVGAVARAGGAGRQGAA